MGLKGGPPLKGGNNSMVNILNKALRKKASPNNRRYMSKRVSKINQVDRGHIYRAFFSLEI